MHVFTKLEFGEYVFLLLSRKIEISYKVKNRTGLFQADAVSQPLKFKTGRRFFPLPSRPAFLPSR